MCYVRALLDWTLTIIEPTVDNGFCEFRNFSIPAIKSSVSTLGDKRIKEITSLERKVRIGFLKGHDTFACLPTGYGKSLIYIIFNLYNWSQLANRWCTKPNRLSGLCRTWQKRHWLLRKRECVRDRKLVGSRQRSPSCCFSLPRRETPLLAGKGWLSMTRLLL